MKTCDEMVADLLERRDTFMKEKRIRTRKIFASLSCLCLAVLLGFGIFQIATSQRGYKIEFPEAGGAVFVYCNDLSYDSEKLQKKITAERAYIYSDAVKPDRSVSEMFPNARIIETDSARTFIDFVGSVTEESVAVDRYGCYKYRTGAGQTTFDIPYSAEESVDIAKGYLKEYGIETDESVKPSSSETWSQYPDGNGNQIKDITERTVIFYSTSDDGYMINHGNTVRVEVNGRGELVGIDCHVKKYSKKRQVSLIPIKEALENMNELNVMVSSTDAYGKMKIEAAELQYWQDERNGESILQPVYDFTVSYNEGKEEFHIIVQANKY